MSKKWNWYEWNDGGEDYGCGNPHKIEGITEDNLSWLPVEKVPVTEFYAFNSLEQPAFAIYTRVEWNGPTYKETVLSKFLEKHTANIGYVLVHKGDILGILGVGIDKDYEFRAGFATVFNARETDYRDDPCRCKKELLYPKVPIILTSLNRTMKSVCYEQGSCAFSHKMSEYTCNDFDDLSDD